MNAASRTVPLSSLSIAITTGEPAGVGPELTVAALAEAAQRWPSVRFTVLGDRELMAERAGVIAVAFHGRGNRDRASRA